MLEAENTVNTASDVTRHAELNLVSQACQTLSAEDRARATLYTSTEPCAMCAGAIYWAGIKSVVYACPASTLAEIAGPSLQCHADDVFNGAIDAPVLKGPMLEGQAAEQHLNYWSTQSWKD